MSLCQCIFFSVFLVGPFTKLPCLRVVCCYFWKTNRNLLKERYWGLACSERLTNITLKNQQLVGVIFLLIIVPSQEKIIVSLSKSFTDFVVLFHKLKRRRYKQFLYVSALIMGYKSCFWEIIKLNINLTKLNKSQNVYYKVRRNCYKLWHRVQRRCVCHQNIKTRRKPLKRWVILIALQFPHAFYIPQTKRLRARSSFGSPSGSVPCASKDMACGYWFSKWRTAKSIWVR